MGADFILAIVEKPQENFQETWKEKIRALTPSDLTELDNLGCPLIPDLDDLDDWDDDGTGEPIDLDHVMNVFAEDLVDTIYHLSWKSPGRDSTWVMLEGRAYLASGGHSWGDPPSDNYDMIVAWDIITEYLAKKSESDLTASIQSN